MKENLKKNYIQYGCGNVAINYWLNFDSSPTLRIQKIPVVGNLLKPWLNCVFDCKIRYGDIVKGLPVPAESADGVFCSHVLEHLTLEDFHTALDNTFKILKPGGVFRCIVPDLEMFVHNYINEISSDSTELKSKASIQLCSSTYLGKHKRKKGIVEMLSEIYGSHHRWMWDKYSLSGALQEHGFIDIESFNQGQSEDKMFILPERDYQFNNAFCLQCRKPE